MPAHLAAAHEQELGPRPVATRRRRLPLAHTHPDRGGAIVAVGGGRRHPLQGRSVGVDARCCAAPAGVGRSGGCAASATRRGGSLDLCRLLIERVPTVCLFVRSENAPAIRLYETMAIQHVLELPLAFFLGRHKITLVLLTAWGTPAGTARGRRACCPGQGLEQPKRPSRRARSRGLALWRTTIKLAATTESRARSRPSRLRWRGAAWA